ncbi:proline--tRNA ligase-like protein [Carex littledalei]|uniref:Proline--tRNA ligase-like protein n=1 Tax=Carex littledalei TaxID=544730 RepID=A0A833VJU6_9POAL|nr:proline--tRNA ligase-like protein [Carex littledalei]
MLLAEGAIYFCYCSNIVDVSSYGELKEATAEGKWARGPWAAREMIPIWMVEDIEAIPLQVWDPEDSQLVLYQEPDEREDSSD